MTYEVLYDEEERQPAKTLVFLCKTWEIKVGRTAAEAHAKEVQKLHDDRKEWLRKHNIWLLDHMKPKKIEDCGYTPDEVFDPEIFISLAEEFRNRLGLKIGNPSQKTIEETA